ncbi:MAG: hypothetical protein F6K11_20835, partial [Leptolyngbya sp. SIO3F4]|nr:hypothetical protein [Leptolyngbya sp. SIO3F4]
MGTMSTLLAPPDNRQISKGFIDVTTNQTSNSTAIKDFDFYARVGCASASADSSVLNNQTFVAKQYTAYPFRLSRT